MGYIVFTVFAAFLLLFIARRSRRARQRAYINNYRFHSSIKDKVREKYPHLGDAQLEMVLEGLREYFHLCHTAKRRMVAMPSQAVDVAWHEFILFTRSYKKFCDKAIGRFLHHTPTVAMKSPTLAQEGIKRSWRLACAKEKIDPKTPTRLPLLFAIDGLLSIPDGFTYNLNCQDPNSPAYGSGYCAGHIGCTSGCAGDSGGGSDSGNFFGGDSSCGSNCGSGCGGGD